MNDVFRWTPEADEYLRKRWLDSSVPSAGVISKEMHISRSAVAGRIHRLGLPKRGGCSARHPHRPRATRKPHIRGKPKYQCIGITSSCAFIAGDPMEEIRSGRNPFCGGKTENGSPYCSLHSRVCYVRGIAA